jgi:NTE family protein
VIQGVLEKVRLDRGLGRYRPDIVYVLSGGAAMGFCHLGMIEALERRGVRPDLVVGTSAGSLFGALYCHYGSVDEVLRRVERVFASEEFTEFERKYFGERKPADGHVQSGLRHFFSGLAGTLKNGMHLGKAMVTTAMVAEKDAVSIFTRIFEGITFDTMKVPFAAVAVDLVEGTPVIFSTGATTVERKAGGALSGPKALMKAVMASSAIPLVFPAVVIGGHAYADGAIMSNLPVREARSLAGEDAYFVGFDVSAPVRLSADGLSTVELVLRLLDLSTRSKQYADRELVDALFQPVDRNYPWSSFAEYEKYLDLGRRHMTGECLVSFERSYLQTCASNVRGDGNVARRLIHAARLKRLTS